MQKYARLRERLSETQALTQDQFIVPGAASDKALLRVHTEQYLQGVISGQLDHRALRRIGFPWSEAMVERSRRSVGGTMAAAQAALSEGVAVNLAGGTHHAFSDQGGGFCVFNDVMVAAHWLHSIQVDIRVVVIDLDVHQGDGSAAIATHKDWIFTFSIHGEKNYPVRKQRSDLDIALADGVEDSEYLKALEQHLPEVLDRFRPDFAFFLAGADPYVKDRLGRMALSINGLIQRDQLVFDQLRQRQLPVAVVMAGGYAPEVDDIVDIHFNTVGLARADWMQRNC